MFRQINVNPAQKSTGDCVIRALSVLLDKSWDEIYLILSIYGFMMKDWGSENSVWDRYLTDLGYHKDFAPNNCPNCYTVKDFCRGIENTNMRFLLATGSHVVAVKDGGIYYDSWDSGNEIVMYYYWK